MDAIRTPRWAWSCAVLALGGCVALDENPAARQEQPAPPELQEPPQVVQCNPAPDDAALEDELNQTVQNWLIRLAAAEQRATDRNGPPLHAASQPTYAADAEPPEKPLIEVLPDSGTEAPRPAEPAPELAPATLPAVSQPPELASLSVQAVPKAGTAAVPDARVPEINAPAYAHSAPLSLRDFLAQLPAAEGDSFREQLDQRMLWVIAGDCERARAPLNLVTAEQQELATRFVETWIVLRDWHMGDQPGAASAAAQQLDELSGALQRLSDLSLPVLKICSAVRGYGQYDAIEPVRLIAGTPNEFVLYCEVRAFVSEQRDDGYYTTFDMTTMILNRVGDAVLEIKDTQIVDRCRNRRHDCFIARLVRLPATLSPGNYVAKVTVVDKLGQKVAENRATLQLVPRP